MSDYRHTLGLISELEGKLPSLFSPSLKPDWKEVWSHIKETGASFKGVRFPTKDEHQQAWDRFQGLVDRVKELQDQDRAAWDQKSRKSADLKSTIIHLARNARPPSGFENAIATIVTGGLINVLESIMGPYDQRKSELQEASKLLKQGWNTLSQHKNEMLGRDKQEAFEALNRAKELLDQEWASYKRDRQNAFDSYRREKERKQENWRRSREEIISNLESRRNRLNDVLSRKEDNLSKLHDMLAVAKSDDFSYTVSSWIEEENESIRDIRRKLNDIEDWIRDEHNKLNS